MEYDLLCLHLPILHVDFVSYENDWNVVADPHKIFVPLRDIFVSDPGRYIEHDNSAICLNAMRKDDIPEKNKGNFTSIHHEVRLVFLDLQCPRR